MLNFLEDTQGLRCELCYIRDKEGREVDFCIVIDKVIRELIEVKLSDTDISRSLIYFSERLKPRQATQILYKPVERFKKNSLVINHVSDEFKQLKRWV